MHLIKPTPMTRAMLVHSTATESVSAWSSGTTYAAGAQALRLDSVYQSLQASNLNHAPESSPTWWTRLGPGNQWAMFDDQVSTQTTQTTGPLLVVMNTGSMDSLAVLAVDADTVRLVVKDGPGGATVFDQTQSMAADEVTSWYEYFFSDPGFRRTQCMFTGIPLFGSSQATLTFSSGSPLKAGHVAFGLMKSLGGLRYGARVGIRDYSRKETDEFGNTTFVVRAFSKYITAALEVNKVDLTRVNNLLSTLRATPVVWVGSDDPYYIEALLVFGFYRDFYASIDYPTLAIYSLEIEGLI